VTTSPRSPTCSHHEGAPAIAICTECGGDVCAACHGSDLRGYCICSACREKFAPPTTPWEDANEDYSPSSFARTLTDVVTGPRSFFQKVRFSSSWVPAVAFGAICMVVGLSFKTTWQLLFFDPYVKALGDLAAQNGLSLEAIKVMAYVSIPFQVALGFLAHTGIFHMAVKIAGAHTTFGLSARIVGYASAGYIFFVVPPIGEFSLGHFLAIIWLFNIEMGALRMYFQMGIWRSMGVVLATLMMMMVFLT
jgi:hypothetical protein